jgi:hypothetical protein
MAADLARLPTANSAATQRSRASAPSPSDGKLTFDFNDFGETTRVADFP